MGIVLALAAAVTYGTADFFGGLATRRATARAVLANSQAIGLVAVLIATPLLGSGSPHGRDLAIGSAGGLAGIVGLLCLYRALALGPMSTAAPLSAATAAAVPVVVGLGLGERPGPTALAGIPLAIVAIVLFSRPSDEERPGDIAHAPASAATIGFAVASGLSFGCFFVSLGKVSADAGFWPVVAGRVTSLAVVLLVCLMTRTSVRVDRDVRRLAVPSGLGDVGANVLVLLANRFGLLSIVSVLSSLYPVPTVVLAQMVLGERFTRVHAAGAAAALVAVVLVALA